MPRSARGRSASEKERERQAALERKRVDDLLENASAFRRARDIRAYVEEASNANADAPEPIRPWSHAKGLTIG